MAKQCKCNPLLSKGFVYDFLNRKASMLYLDNLIQKKKHFPYVKIQHVNYLPKSVKRFSNIFSKERNQNYFYRTKSVLKLKLLIIICHESQNFHLLFSIFLLLNINHIKTKILNWWDLSFVAPWATYVEQIVIFIILLNS